MVLTLLRFHLPIYKWIMSIMLALNLSIAYRAEKSENIPGTYLLQIQY